MLQFHHADGIPTLENAMSLFGLAREDIDVAFGVLATDPREDLYVILVKSEALPKVHAALRNRPKRAGEGVFANPKIGPFDC
jgi:hypothetical protein